jgi:hypothetical protein
VRGADFRGAEHTPFRIEPEVGQRSEDSAEVPSDGWYVFHEDDSWL